MDSARLYSKLLESPRPIAIEIKEVNSQKAPQAERLSRGLMKNR